jgi:hypothetical protein
MARRVTKTLTYRDQTGANLAAHTEHWRGFVWQAGPVIVTHKDGPWGVVQVWASSIEEGKRVIRHAASIAGVDPDAEGRWEISGTTNPRYGRSATLAPLVLKGGEISVTKREGSSGTPYVVASDP